MPDIRHELTQGSSRCRIGRANASQVHEDSNQMRNEARFRATPFASTCARPRDSSHQIPVPARTSSLLTVGKDSLGFMGSYRCANCDGFGSLFADSRPSRQIVNLSRRTICCLPGSTAERACQAAGTTAAWGKRAAGGTPERSEVGSSKTTFNLALRDVSALNRMAVRTRHAGEHHAAVDAPASTRDVWIAVSRLPPATKRLAERDQIRGCARLALFEVALGVE